jgi:hypothetical protein
MDAVKKKKGFMDYLKDGFKPTHSRAQEEVAEERSQGPTQYELDMKKDREERAKAFKRGFFDRRHD